MLILRLDQPLNDLPIGRLGRFDFAPGVYFYVGSAFGSGGLAARLAYHQRQRKARPHWHIDYLRAEAHLCEAWSVGGGGRLECVWCRALAAYPAFSIPVPGFGARDTGCPAHLFYQPCFTSLGLLTSLILTDVISHPDQVQIEIHSFDELIC